MTRWTVPVSPEPQDLAERSTGAARPAGGHQHRTTDSRASAAREQRSRSSSSSGAASTSTPRCQTKTLIGNDLQPAHLLGGGPPNHTDSREDKSIYVFSGRLEVGL